MNRGSAERPPATGNARVSRIAIIIMARVAPAATVKGCQQAAEASGRGVREHGRAAAARARAARLRYAARARSSSSSSHRRPPKLSLKWPARERAPAS
jgi:hypothetical protein